MNDTLMGTSLPYAERRRLGLMGRMPHKEESLAQQRRRIHRLVQAMQSPFDQHLLLRQLQEDNPVLFYDLVRHHLPELLPIIYTPVVGEACQRHSDLYLRSHGLYLSWHDRDDLDAIFDSVEQEVDVIVISDGERVLGLGDLGIGGMGICIGKLALYSAAGGIDPARTLPLCVDVGTNNPELLEDDSYLGWQAPRIDGEAYYHFMDKVVAAIRRRWPQVVLQFEDFAGKHAANLLARYRDELCMFNDDIQGTAAVTSACVLAGLRQAGRALADTPVLIVGAGAAGCGIAAMLAQLAGGSDTIWLFDQEGVVSRDRADLTPGQRPFARPAEEASGDLAAVIQRLRPGVLIGVSGQGGLFTRAVLETMGEVNERPVILPLSNPTRSAEATPQQVWEASGERALIATGSPFAPVPVGESLRSVSQCNNVYVFPGIGLGATAVKARRISDGMLLAAVEAVGAYPLEAGRLLPPIEQVGEVARAVARAVALAARAEGLAEFDGDPAPVIDRAWWRPHYWALR
ncbi:malate dehydrogenase [Aeromonas diversa CDC 2478-85]|uniref:Malate dehydrogenase n=1 Tax=Aeromonas diversa CDC 2478-85 TaxID=1268237 RepID=N9VQ39_9GAMM|nr:oxaloacetate-decarboxylating malate dehydrogenase [Aeromonas diversa]ENY73648.1 malate dehydrogenase [Aeromonas diversa CDC 2478-85]